ncbi:RluA family pseudouridine synthase [Patescibacteria group bacterium]|nr:RluA family pseudouridine synthase [Patescibacteria group bacterium]MBU2036371.1 RluA family pseudouridine synthase [Patescibacteria group bacterium]
MGEPNIVFEDKYLLILDKPSGWIVNSAVTTKEQPVVQKWLRDNFDYEISKDDLFRSGVVHRIDKETSGLLIVAKTKTAFRELQRQFKQREVGKTYITLVHGKVSPEGGTIEVPVGRLPWRRDRFGIVAGGRNSKTDYKLLDLYKKDNDYYSLLECFPKTGRTHQIRIHMKHINHAIVGDYFYAGRKTSRRDREWCPRLFLHAQKISFTHPVFNKKIEFELSLPSDLNKALKNLSLEKEV